MSATTNPNWFHQVKCGRGRVDTGAHHRAVDVARRLHAAGRWPDPAHTIILIHDAYDAHNRMVTYHDPLAQGVDYEFYPYLEQ